MGFILHYFLKETGKYMASRHYGVYLQSSLTYQVACAACFGSYSGLTFLA